MSLNTDYAGAIGKQITSAYKDGNAIRITFVDGSRLFIQDDGQSCCEHRYLTCDDEVESMVGEFFSSISTTLGNDRNSDSDMVHEICFVTIYTNRDHYTLCTHNIHNGYYGGFDIVASYIPPETTFN